MNPLAITPAFSGEIEIPKAAFIERDEVISSSKQITGVNSQEELELAVNALRDLTSLEKVTEAGRAKEKRPFLDFSKLIDSFAAKFIAPVTTEKTRITGYVNDWQRKEAMRKQAEERKRQDDIRKAEDEARAAQKKIDDQQREIERQQQLAEQAKTAAARKKAADALALAQAEQLKQRLLAEEANMARQSAAIVPSANTPSGLATRVSYDFEIVDAHKLIAKKPALFRWKAGEESFHFDRANFRVALNSSVPNEYTGWRPPEDTESVVMSDYGVRIFVSVKTNVRS